MSKKPTVSPEAKWIAFCLGWYSWKLKIVFVECAESAIIFPIEKPDRTAPSIDLISEPLAEISTPNGAVKSRDNALVFLEELQEKSDGGHFKEVYAASRINFRGWDHQWHAKSHRLLDFVKTCPAKGSRKLKNVFADTYRETCPGDPEMLRQIDGPSSNDYRPERSIPQPPDSPLPPSRLVSLQKRLLRPCRLQEPGSGLLRD